MIVRREITIEIETNGEFCSKECPLMTDDDMTWGEYCLYFKGGASGASRPKECLDAERSIAIDLQQGKLTALEEHLEGMNAKIIHLWFTQSGNDPVDDWFAKAREILGGE